MNVAMCLVGNMSKEDSAVVFSFMGSAFNTTGEIISAMCFKDSTTNVIRGMMDNTHTEGKFDDEILV